MTTLREAAEMALEALKQSRPKPCDEDDDYAELAWKKHTAAIDFLRKALDADSMASFPESKPYWVTERQIDRNEIVKMARAAGFFYSSGGSEYMLCRIPNLERLTTLIVAAKREWKGLVDKEPVAWMVYTLDGSSAFVTDNPKDFTENHRALPLYTAPPAAPVQEPVACQHKKPICDSQGKTLGYSDWKDGKGLAWWPHRSLYTAPPRREWQGLTDEEIWSDGSRMGLSEGGIRRFAREIEAKLKEKNT
jgi:hypothetical protein